jgi:hypothetical protein
VIVPLKGTMERIEFGVGEKTLLDFAEAEAFFNGCTGGADFFGAVPNQQDTSVSEPVQHQGGREYDNYDAGYHGNRTFGTRPSMTSLASALGLRKKILTLGDTEVSVPDSRYNAV